MAQYQGKYLHFNQLVILKNLFENDLDIQELFPEEKQVYYDLCEIIARMTAWKQREGLENEAKRNMSNM